MNKFKKDLIVLCDNKFLTTLIESKQDFTLAKQLGELYCGFTEDDSKYIDIFWQAAYNKSWLYVSQEMVIDHLGYADGGRVLRNFYRKLEKSDEYDEEYKEIDEKEAIEMGYEKPDKSRGGHNRKHYMITGECFKLIACNAQTEQGKKIRRYFVKVETLATMVFMFIAEYFRRKAERMSDLDKIS